MKTVGEPMKKGLKAIIGSYEKEHYIKLLENNLIIHLTIDINYTKLLL